MTGTLLLVPVAVNVSVLQRDSESGWPMLNDTKSNLKSIDWYNFDNFPFNIQNN